MKLPIRALGWATYILWLIIIVFTVTVVYSASQLGIDFDEPKTIVSEGSITLSWPFSLNNSGFYDILDLNISTLIQDQEGFSLANSSTFVPIIARGSRIYTVHNVSISLDDVTSEQLSYLLLNDTVLSGEISFALTYANVIPFKISTNLIVPWGAPLHNLTVGNIAVDRYNHTHLRVAIPLSFENHSAFSLNGTMRLEVINNRNEPVGAAATPINVPSQSGYSTQVDMFVSVGSGNLREARLYFDTSAFSYGPMVIPIA